MSFSYLNPSPTQSTPSPPLSPVASNDSSPFLSLSPASPTLNTLADDSSDSYFSSSENVPDLRSLLASKVSRHKHAYNICHINAQSIPAHHSDLIACFAEPDSPVDAVLVSETWLRPTLPTNLYKIAGFTLIRNDRSGNRRGGGVALYLRDKTPYNIIASSAGISAMEYSFVETKLRGKTLLIGVVYCPPSTNYFAEFDCLLSTIMGNYSDVVIMGDFNTCLTLDDHRSSQLRNCVESVNLNILPLGHTHCTPGCRPSQIDHMLVTCPDRILCHGQIDAGGFSNHDAIST